MAMPVRIRMLDRKLLRDLWAMKGQATAIAAVMAAGVTMFVAYFSNFDSLQRAPPITSSGLADGTTVLVHPSDLVRDGGRIVNRSER